MPLPEPDVDALAYSATLTRHIRSEIDRAGGWIGFDRFMELALYAPGMGYYSGGSHKFGAAGDFVTAPELSSVFSRTLATQVAQCHTMGLTQIIEVGAGSGRLAADLLLELEQRNALPSHYRILELSGELRARQQETLARCAPYLLDRVSWLDSLPEHFAGMVIANELLDAMPVHLVHWRADEGIYERGVAIRNGEFTWEDRPATGQLLDRARQLAAGQAIPSGYLSEISLAAPAWIAGWRDILERGVLLLIDYGFPRHEYYHPQRNAGTLMCHYRHHAHGEPFYLPGLQDITAHVDFTAIVEAGCGTDATAKLDFLGYTTQSTFLFNCGLTGVLARTPAADTARYLPLANAAQKLVSPAEMGELFKVIALGKGINETLTGFQQGDRSETL